MCVCIYVFMAEEMESMDGVVVADGWVRCECQVFAQCSGGGMCVCV